MLTPEQVQDQVLLYLYDLLDDTERRAFEATLEASSEARATLTSAEAKRQLLAEAVKHEFPDVTFTPPAAPAPSKQQSAPTLVMPRRRDVPRRHWVPWAAAAASVAILLGGGGYLSIAAWMSYKNRVDS